MSGEAAWSCIAALGSTTQAIKAQRVLLGSGIPAEVLPLAPSQTRRGCAFGVSFSCSRLAAVRAELQNAGIPVSQFIKREEPFT